MKEKIERTLFHLEAFERHRFYFKKKYYAINEITMEF
jgi:hypothetical protein